MPAPYAFARRGGDLLLVCTNHDGTSVRDIDDGRRLWETPFWGARLAARGAGELYAVDGNGLVLLAD